MYLSHPEAIPGQHAIALSLGGKIEDQTSDGTASTRIGSSCVLADQVSTWLRRIMTYVVTSASLTSVVAPPMM